MKERKIKNNTKKAKKNLEKKPVLKESPFSVIVLAGRIQQKGALFTI